MSRCASILLALLVLGAAGCTAPADPELERATLLRTDRAWAQAAASGDVTRIASFWAEDALNFFPGQPVAIGREAILDLVRENRARPGFSLSWEPAMAEVSDSGDLGYTWGVCLLAHDGPDGERVERKGNYVIIWRKDSEGLWKCAVESTTFAP